MRWADANDAGNDHGLAIDDLSVSATTTVLDGPPAVSSFTPANSASNVPVTTAVTVNFSEAVNLTADAVTLGCPTGTPVAFTGLPATNVISITLTPSVALPSNTTCTATVSRRR